MKHIRMNEINDNFVKIVRRAAEICKNFFSQKYL